MPLRRSAVIAIHELRLAGQEPGMFVQLLLMPIVMIAFLKPAFGPALAAGGLRHVNGAEQAVPGMVTMFSMFAAGMVGFSFFREHSWRTWDRLRSSQARPIEIIAGKVVPAAAITIAQQAVVFAVGMLLFGLAVPGSVAGLCLICLSLTFAFVAFGVLLAAWLRSAQQMNTVSSVVAFVMTGIGGAFAPIDVLPSWARAVAPLTPTYWAMEGFRAVTLHAGTFASTLRPVGALIGFGALFTVLAARRFSFDETKRYSA
jgi:ABC-2 type transport system permease protein